MQTMQKSHWRLRNEKSGMASVNPQSYTIMGLEIFRLRKPTEDFPVSHHMYWAQKAERPILAKKGLVDKLEYLDGD